MHQGSPRATGASPRYSRAPGIVHRTGIGSVLVAPLEGPVQKLVGAAGFAWLVLDQAGTAAELHDRLLTQWPDLPLHAAEPLQEALDLLVGAAFAMVDG